MGVCGSVTETAQGCSHSSCPGSVQSACLPLPCHWHVLVDSPAGAHGCCSQQHSRREKPLPACATSAPLKYVEIGSACGINSYPKGSIQVGINSTVNLLASPGEAGAVPAWDVMGESLRSPGSWWSTGIYCSVRRFSARARRGCCTSRGIFSPTSLAQP